MDIISIIKKDRKIKDNSLQAYITSLKKINDDKEIENINFLKNVKKIEDKLKDLKLTTKKNRYTSILVLLRAVGGQEELLKKYREKLDELTEEYFKEISKNQKTEAQSKNWVSLKELKKVMNTYKEEVKGRGLKNKNKLNAKETVLLQNYLITSLYLLIPPKRLDYNVKIVKKRSQIKDGDNYLLNENKRNKTFIIQDFKTSKSHGTQEFKVPKELNNIINLSLQFNNTGFLLLNNRGGRLSSNGLGKMVKRAFAPTGKEITLNLLRKITISELVDHEALKKNKKLADDMGHSVNVQQTVYLKD